MTAGTQRAPFGTMPDGTAVELYTLCNANGAMLRVTNYGTIITELHVPDREGQLGDVVLGFDNLQQYLDGHPYFGCTVGRVANRIANASFTLDGTVYQLSRNSGAHHLHGGAVGFDKAVWHATPLDGGCVGVRFRHVSSEGDQGYPGRLDVQVVMSLDDADTLTIEYTATTDRATPVSLTNHSYFNLATSGSVLDHQVMIAASHFTPTDAELIPTGDVAPVQGTPLDFTVMRHIGERLSEVGGPLPGYDHNYVLPHSEAAPVLAARVHEPVSGRMLSVLTTEPGLQFYTGNALDGSLVGKRGKRFAQHAGLCLEAQQFPDAPHHPGFRPGILRPGEQYHQVTQYRFHVA